MFWSMASTYRHLSDLLRGFSQRHQSCNLRAWPFIDSSKQSMTKAWSCSAGKNYLSFLFWSLKWCPSSSHNYKISFNFSAENSAVRSVTLHSLRIDSCGLLERAFQQSNWPNRRAGPALNPQKVDFWSALCSVLFWNLTVEKPIQLHDYRCAL